MAVGGNVPLQRGNVDDKFGSNPLEEKDGVRYSFSHVRCIFRFSDGELNCQPTTGVNDVKTV